MIIGKVEGATKTLIAPKDWDAERNGECMDLPIREEVVNGSLPALTSAWLPTPRRVGEAKCRRAGSTARDRYGSPAGHA